MTTQTEFTAKDIHAEFYSAEEKLLQEAKAVLEDHAGRKAQIADRISRLGFRSARPVKSSAEFASKRADAADLAHHIEYYRERYPLNKFITEAEVQRICKKYGLLLGEAANYTGDIPEKNLENIERFVLRKKDYHQSISYSTGDWRMPSSLSGWHTFMTTPHTFMTTPNASPGVGFDGMIPAILTTGTGTVSQIYWESFKQIGPGIAGYDPVKIDDYVQDKPKKKTSKVPKLQKPPFKICAPERDFHTSGYVVKEGYILVYDPVVLQPVKKGYLIVDAWGEEASDELVMNPVKN